MYFYIYYIYTYRGTVDDYTRVMISRVLFRLVASASALIASLDDAQEWRRHGGGTAAALPRIDPRDQKKMIEEVFIKMI